MILLAVRLSFLHLIHTKVGSNYSVLCPFISYLYVTASVMSVHCLCIGSTLPPWRQTSAKVLWQRFHQESKKSILFERSSHQATQAKIIRAKLSSSYASQNSREEGILLLPIGRKVTMGLLVTNHQ